MRVLSLDEQLLTACLGKASQNDTILLHAKNTASHSTMSIWWPAKVGVEWTGGGQQEPSSKSRITRDEISIRTWMLVSNILELLVPCKCNFRGGATRSVVFITHMCLGDGRAYRSLRFHGKSTIHRYSGSVTRIKRMKGPKQKTKDLSVPECIIARPLKFNDTNGPILIRPPTCRHPRR